MFNMYHNGIKHMLRDGCAGIPNLSPLPACFYLISIFSHVDPVYHALCCEVMTLLGPVYGILFDVKYSIMFDSFHFMYIL